MLKVRVGKIRYLPLEFLFLLVITVIKCCLLSFSRDVERMRKVKEIEHMLSNQQAETNALNRKKRKLGK